MIYITDLRIEPNPVDAGQTITVEIEIREIFQDAKRYPYKYPYRYTGNMAAEGRKYPYKYPRKADYKNEKVSF